MADYRKPTRRRPTSRSRSGSSRLQRETTFTHDTFDFDEDSAYESDSYSSRESRSTRRQGSRQSAYASSSRDSYTRQNRRSDGYSQRSSGASGRYARSNGYDDPYGDDYDDFSESRSRRSSERVRPVRSVNQRPSKAKTAIVAIILVAAVVAIGVFAYFQMVSSNLHEGINRDLENALVETDLNNEPFYMLLMGTDGSAEREESGEFGDQFRSDSIMLVRIDPVNKKVAMVSIHRDSLVDLGSEYGEQKINAAHALGGPALSVKAVSAMAGVPISHYAEINFDGFCEIVDALGGIEVDVPVDIDDDEAGGSLDAGLQTLNGEQALILCRSRNTYGTFADPDSMRAANQRLVMSAIARKLLDSDVATIANSVNALSRYVTTDLEVNDIIGLAQNMQGLNPETDIYTAMEPVTSEYIDGGWYSRTVEDEWRKMIERMDQGLPPSENGIIDEVSGTVLATSGDAEILNEKTAWIAVRNGTSINGAGSEAAKRLQAAGFVNVDSADANADDYEDTLIIYDEDIRKYEANVVRDALGAGRVMKNDGEYLYNGDILVLIGADWEEDED